MRSRFRLRVTTAAVGCALAVAAVVPAVARSQETRGERAAAEGGPAESFAALDKDDDGQLKLDELLANQPDKNHPRLKQQFVVFDFDGSAALSLEEFRAMPGKLPPEKRDAVPDPIARLRDAAFEKWQALSTAADRDGDGVLTQREWPAAQLTETVPALADATFAMFDRDGNGRVDSSEAESLFDIAFGLARPDGRPLRTVRGSVLNLSYARGIDTDHDGYLSHHEFVSRYHKGPEENAALFSARDADGDGRLSTDELEPIFWMDLPGRFLSADKDMDGYLSGAELIQSVPAGRHVAERTVRAFDGDGDGKLSFAEYRATTFANPVSDLNRPRRDADNDGRLSPGELYTEPSPLLLALYRHFFDHFDLDKDGFLSLRELKFNVDLDKAKPEIALEAKDLDGDGKLAFAEFFTEKQPADGDARALDRYEMRVARAENRFQDDDRDASGYLDLDELIASQQSAMEAARRHSNVLANRKTMLEGNYWVRKGVLVVNEIAFLAVVWMVVRRARRR